MCFNESFSGIVQCSQLWFSGSVLLSRIECFTFSRSHLPYRTHGWKEQSSSVSGFVKNKFKSGIPESLEFTYVQREMRVLKVVATVSVAVSGVAVNGL